MVLFTPLLAGAVQNVAGTLALMLAKGAGIILFVIVSARYLVPKLLYHVARTRIPELFLATLLVICLAVVWLTSSLGLSLALGAFLAGLIVSDSEYSHQALGNIIPFRDVFTSFFFVSIGMLLDVGFCIQEPLLITGAALGVFLLKSFVAALVALLVGLPLRTALLVGLSLGQLGEFSFILSKEGLSQGLLAGNAYQVFLAVAILTMAATPFIVRYSARIADRIMKLPFPDRMKTRCVSCAADGGLESLKEHLIIVGFGLTGRNLGEAAKAAGIPYTVTEMNVDTVRSQQAKGEPIFLGDATQDSVLRHARIHQARVVAVAINDPTATRRITAVVRRLNPKVFIIVRTRYIIEVEPLYRMGANMVIPEEYETSVEIFTRVLAEYEIPPEEINRFANQVREAGYRMFRSPSRDWKEGA
jgi:CPA2 family monovalent cation:H+ antiporter-2